MTRSSSDRLTEIIDRKPVSRGENLLYSHKPSREIPALAVTANPAERASCLSAYLQRTDILSVFSFVRPSSETGFSDAAVAAAANETIICIRVIKAECGFTGLKILVFHSI